MKKLAILFVSLLFVLAVNTGTFAQLKFGAKAGLNIANIGGDDADNTDSKIGLVLGGLMSYQFSDMFAVQPEVLYTMKGATDEGGGTEYTLSLNYIEIPVLLKFLIPIQGSGSIVPAIYAGPSIAFNVSAESESESQGRTTTTDLDDWVSSVDFGLAFGGSIAFDIGSANQIGADVRYTLGLSSVEDAGLDADIKNNVFSITAFFIF
jgi:hypothetical protein